MQIPIWKDPHRKRNIRSNYLDKDYVKYYDLDLQDLSELVEKLRNNERLSEQENDRYGIYLITICLIVQENPKFKNKSRIEREEILDQQLFELLTGIKSFNPNKGSSIYSYAYRIGYTAACHYYTFKNKEKEEQDKIVAHVKEELDDYYYEFSSHKVNSINHD